jgi:sugar/nucleoside kinase (ribokinase family)
MREALFVGLTTVDIQFQLPYYPKENSKHKSNTYHIAAGGPACNAAIAFAYLGGRAQFVSAIGKNTFTQFLNEDIITHKVELIDVAKETKTGTGFWQAL